MNIQNMEETLADDEVIPALADVIDLDALENTLSFFIRSLNIAVSRDWDERVADLAPIQGVGKVTALLLISRHPGIRPSVIAQIAMKNRSEIGRTLNGLEANGLLTRRVDSTDSRARALFLTEEGERMADEVRKRIRESRGFFEDLSEEEYRAVITPLRALYWRLVAKSGANAAEMG